MQDLNKGKKRGATTPLACKVAKRAAQVCTCVVLRCLLQQATSRWFAVGELVRLAAEHTLLNRGALTQLMLPRETLVWSGRWSPPKLAGPAQKQHSRRGAQPLRCRAWMSLVQGSGSFNTYWDPRAP